MQTPKLTQAQFQHAVETGEASEYLAAHCEMAPVFAPGSKKPRYDIILDAEASDELFRQYSGGETSFQNASVEEVQAFVEGMDRQCNSRRNPLIRALVRWSIVASIAIIFIVMVSLMPIFLTK